MKRFIIAVILLLPVLLQIGCASVKQYSIDSYPGPFSMDDQRWLAGPKAK